MKVQDVALLMFVPFVVKAESYDSLTKSHLELSTCALLCV